MMGNRILVELIEEEKQLGIFWEYWKKSDAHSRIHYEQERTEV